MRPGAIRIADTLQAPIGGLIEYPQPRLVTKQVAKLIDWAPDPRTHIPTRLRLAERAMGPSSRIIVDVEAHFIESASAGCFGTEVPL